MEKIKNFLLTVEYYLEPYHNTINVALIIALIAGIIF